MPLLSHIETTSCLMMAIVAVVRFNDLEKDLKILSSFFVVAVAFEAVELYMAFHNMNNLFLVHFYTLGEYIAVMLVMSFWQKTITMQKIFRGSIIAYLLIWVGAELYVENMTAFNNFTSSLSSLLCITAASYTLFGVIDDHKGSLLRDSRFWILTAVLFYYSGNLVFFALSNALLLYSRPEIVFAWSLHWMIGIITNGFYARGYLCKAPR